MHASGDYGRFRVRRKRRRRSTVRAAPVTAPAHSVARQVETGRLGEGLFQFHRPRGRFEARLGVGIGRRAEEVPQLGLRQAGLGEALPEESVRGERFLGAPLLQPLPSALSVLPDLRAGPGCRAKEVDSLD